MPGVQEEGGNGMGLAAMIIGIVGMLLALIPIIGFISWILAPLAIVFGLIGLNRSGKGFAITGIITGGLGLLICIAWLGLWMMGAQVAQEIQDQARQSQVERAMGASNK